MTELQAVVRRQYSIRGTERERDRWLCNHILEVDNSEKEAPWSLKTHKTGTPVSTFQIHYQKQL